jgi:plasmid stabilization system protein ParE
MNVVFRKETLADLEAIADFASKHNPQAAAPIIQRIHRVIYRHSRQASAMSDIVPASRWMAHRFAAKRGCCTLTRGRTLALAR